MSSQTRAATSTSPLPEGWSELEKIEDVVVAAGLSLRRAGVCSVAPTGETITGSAAESGDASGEGSAPVRRATFELLERAATLTALSTRDRAHALLGLDGGQRDTIAARELFPESEEPARYRFARSNGVALHVSWKSAALRARWELAERDRVLRSWCGDERPRSLALGSVRTGLLARERYELLAFDLGRADFAPEASVVGVVGFPRRPDEPLAMGFAARPEPEAALDAALGEALQSLAFLVGEPVPTEQPPLAPSPLAHLEHWQYAPNHEELRAWLDGAHVGLARAGVLPRGPGPSRDVLYVDLTPRWLAPGLHVVKAVCARAAPLAFGDVPFLRDFPVRARVHPLA